VWPDDRGIPEEGGPDSDVPEDDDISLWDYVPRGNPMGRQEGGDHYTKLAIQPIEYILGNDLGWCEANVVKYITRHHDKGGADDVRKAIHYCQMLLEKEYGE
jgi:hypothetical protein